MTGNKTMVQGIAVDQVRAVVFDLGGVFLEGTVENAIRFGEKVGLSAEDWLEIRKVLFLGNGAWDELERGEITLDAFAEILQGHLARRGVNIGLEQARNFMGSPGESFYMRLRREIVDGCLAVRQVMPTALLTNNVREWREGWRNRLELESLFNAIVDSSEVGMRKPEPQIYKLVEERLGMEGEGLLFIDDLGINLKAARQLGWQTLKYDDTRKVVEVLKAVSGNEGGV